MRSCLVVSWLVLVVRMSTDGGVIRSPAAGIHSGIRAIAIIAPRAAAESEFSADPDDPNDGYHQQE